MRCEPLLLSSSSQRSSQQQPFPSPPSVVIAFDNTCSARTETDYSPFCNDDETTPREIDYEALLSHPVLPPNPHFFWFKQKIHITVSL